MFVGLIYLTESVKHMYAEFKWSKRFCIEVPPPPANGNVGLRAAC